MKNILGKLQSIVVILGVVSAIGGGFYTWGQFNLRLDSIENMEIQSVDLAPLETQIAILEEKVSKLEKAADNNKNPLAQWKKNEIT